MLRKIPYEPAELKIVGEIPSRFGGPPTPVRNAPVSGRENLQALYQSKQPYWLPTSSSEQGTISVPLYNNLLGRGGPDGTVDAFGLEWVYVESAMGSIVHPGTPHVENANELKDKVVYPDLDSWDWAGAAEETKVDMTRAGVISLVNGFWFERLISFMDFAPAAVALVDEDQQDAVKSFFEDMTDFAIKVVDKFLQYWPALDGINIHDDWGAQKNAFFSDEVARELFLPYMKELTGHVHSKGRFCTLHSCGNIEKKVQIFIEGGFDQWDPQTMNDTHKLYEDFGDQIVISVIPEVFDPETTSEDEQRQRARDHVDRFVQPGKPSMLGVYGNWALQAPAFANELYEYSRKKYLSF
ncbi:MAG: methyltransferase [Eubacteriaceae bacterium]|nr:methyltransferase [Eubacteriaceae bacterium]